MTLTFVVIGTYGKSIGGVCFLSRQGHEIFFSLKISDGITFSGKNAEKNGRGNNPWIT